MKGFHNWLFFTEGGRFAYYGTALLMMLMIDLFVIATIHE